MVTESAPVTELSSLKGEVRYLEPDRLGRSVARRSAEVRATVPDLELSCEIDACAALAVAADHGCSLSAILVRACARALAESPRANAAYRDGRFEHYSRVNVGVTFWTETGPATPTLLDADRMSLDELESELTRLRARAMAGELTPPELAGTTFTFTDLSEHPRVHRYAPLITPPQAAALAAGAVRRAPTLRGDVVVPGDLLTLSLTCDHRILFGAHAAAFLNLVAADVETAGR